MRSASRDASSRFALSFACHLRTLNRQPVWHIHTTLATHVRLGRYSVSIMDEGDNVNTENTLPSPRHAQLYALQKDPWGGPPPSIILQHPAGKRRALRELSRVTPLIVGRAGVHLRGSPLTR